MIGKLMANLSKDEYILRSLNKLRRKKWEYYIISRIFHRLNDHEIEFVTQQYVKRSNGSYSLTDLYFPQFNIHLEVDEEQHGSPLHAEADELRQQDIVDATGGEIVRIKTYTTNEADKICPKALSDIDLETDAFIDKIRASRTELSSSFAPWDYYKKFDPQVFLDQGYISLDHPPRFRYQRDVLRLFGYTGGNYQRAVWNIPSGRVSSTSNSRNEKFVWLPKLFEHANWKNTLSSDGCLIEETYRHNNESSKSDLNEASRNRIVFAHRLNPLGQKIYRFYGEFAPDLERSELGRTVFVKVADRVSLDWVNN